MATGRATGWRSAWRMCWRCFIRAGLVGAPLFCAGVSAWGQRTPAPPTTPPLLTLVAAPYPPLIVKGDLPDTFAGPLAERIVEVVQQAGFATRAGFYPLPRALEVAKATDDTCLLLVTRTPERAPLYQWVGPIFYRKLVLYTAPGSTLELKSLADARGLRVGAELGNAVIGYLKAEGVEPELAPTPENNARKLLAGRIDVWANMDLIAKVTLQTHKLPELRAAYAFANWEGHMACNLKLDARRVARLQAAIAEARGRGVFKVFEE